MKAGKILKAPYDYQCQNNSNTYKIRRETEFMGHRNICKNNDNFGYIHEYMQAKILLPFHVFCSNLSLPSYGYEKDSLL
jgi:hypothetical protein